MTKEIRGAWQALRPAVTYAAGIALGLRVMLSMIAAMAYYQFPEWPTTYYHGVPPVPSGWTAYVIGVWQRFDAVWYQKIALEGYRWGNGSTVFFPLYPTLMRFVGDLIGYNYLTAGLLISTCSIFGALIFLYKLTELEFDAQAGRRSLIYLTLFPTALFLFGVYTESTFLVFSIGAFYFVRTRRWGVACLMGMLAALTRQVGVLLVLPLAYEYMAEREFRWQAIRPGLLLLLLIPAGTLAFLLYRSQVIGDSFSITETYRRLWAVRASWPWLTLANSFRGIVDPGWAPPLNDLDTPVRRVFYNVFNFSTAILAITLTGLVFLRMRFSYGVYTFGTLFVLMMQNFRGPYPLAAFPRYFLSLFPIFMVVAATVRHKGARRTIWVFSAMWLSLFTAMFATWRIVA